MQAEGMPLHAAAEELCVSAANLAKLFGTRGRGMGMSVIGHGIVGKDIPIMAHLAKVRRWSKR